jgi:hypothetical protein
MGREERINRARHEASPGVALKEYIVVREIGTEAFEKVVNAHLELGYIPCGGVSIFPAVKATLAGAQPGLGFAQALWLPPEEERDHVPDA